MTDDWSVFLDILGPELAAAATAPFEAPAPPPAVVDVLRQVFTADAPAVTLPGGVSTDAA